MVQAGVGVLLNQLFGSGDRSSAVYEAAIGKTISSITLNPDANGGDGALVFRFSDGYSMQLADKGRSCCENRYMTCDDDLAYHTGATFLSADVASAPDVKCDYGEHEVQFLVVLTSAGRITCETHNENNGYYGGFWIAAEKLSDADEAEGM